MDMDVTVPDVKFSIRAMGFLFGASTRVLNMLVLICNDTGSMV